MSVDSVIRQGRAFTEALMESSGVVLRENGVSTSANGTTETPNFDTIYSGPCRLKFGGTEPDDKGIPGALVANQAAVLSLPVDGVGSADVMPGDIWECTSNPLDSGLVGKRLRIAGVHAQTHATARRFPVVEVS